MGFMDEMEEKIVRQRETAGHHLVKAIVTSVINPDMLILGSSKSAANNDMMSKMWTNGETIT